MASTIKRILICASKEDLRQLDELAEKFGETKAQVFKRALYNLYNETSSHTRPKNYDRKNSKNTTTR